MRKFARIIGVIFLLVTVCFTGFTTDFSMANIRRLGTSANNNVANLRRFRLGDSLNYNITSTIGGVILQATATPTGNAAGQPVTVKYDPLRADGRRLALTIGNKEIRTDLYDWEIIPIARFAESGYAACMTLFDDPRTEEEEVIDALFEEGDINWVNFHPAFGDTLIGLNLFFVDAMFVITDLLNIDLIQFADEVFVFPVPGYHKPRLSRRDTDIARRSLHKKYIDLELAFGAENVNTYIYTDYGTEISYRIRNRKIVFTGVPSYLFLINDHENETVTPAAELNKQIASLHKKINAVNPVVYRSAERTAQWAAFFRMVKKDHPQVWEEFMGQIDGIEPAPTTNA